METPKIVNEIVGKPHTFSGGLFSSKKAIEPTEFDVLDWRWGSAFIMDMKTMEEKHPTIEFLVKREGMARSRWTRQFPCKEYVSDGDGGWKKKKA